MYDHVKEGWKKSSERLAGTDAFWERSTAQWLLKRDIRDALKKHSKGKLLDAGAGTLSCRHIAKEYCADYVSLDFKKTHPQLDHVADIQAMPLPEASFDTVLCVEVLEHVPHPQQALSEIWRVLKPNGKLVITVPHMGYLHNEPYDFYRYTKHGLHVLLEEAGFRVLSLKPCGGLLSFLQLSFATMLIGVSENVPVLREILQGINRLMSRGLMWLDERLDKRKIYALHYVAVAEKSQRS